MHEGKFRLLLLTKQPIFLSPQGWGTAGGKALPLHCVDREKERSPRWEANPNGILQNPG
ncbi:hypothetical protein B4135_2100 [Caldibacillus debilis]|uniref:Uncharacterized protein n=1 Tax=Caldibacillus debilis TaxID=301148 RepID=A0A150M5I9_9BACI|nr:hypothetical protein B4135_2100 [Caldibacillus debilis]